MAKYHKDKSFRVTVVSGTTTTGLYAKDGSTNVVDAATGGGLPTYASWNPDDITAGTTLTNNNLTATATSGTNRGVRGTRGMFTGKFYWEATCVVQGSIGDSIGLGAFSAPLGVTTGACVVVRGGTIYVNGTSNTVIGPLNNGDLIQIAADLTAKLIWFRISRISPNWNASGTANPATGVGGINISVLTEALFPFAAMAATATSWTANFGASAFANAVPSGFEPGWPPATPTTLQWDPETVTGVTLSNGGMTATSTGTTSADQGARVHSLKGKTAGKFYFEVTWTTLLAGANIGIGIGTTASTYTNMGTSGTVGNIIYRSGTIYNNGSSSGVTITPRASGDVIAVAADIDNRRIWFRLSPTGNWNNNPAANPATNSGGMVIPAGTMVPFCTFGGAGGVAGSVATSNFGTSAFSGAVPSGYTAGWPGPSGSGSGSGAIGAYHRCGALNVIRTTAPVQKLRAPSGAMYVTTTPYANRGTKITIVSGTLS